MKQNTNLKTIAGIFVFLAVFLLAIFFSVIYLSGPGLYVYAEQISEEPDNFMELSRSELENYPYIQKAVSSPGTEIKVPYKDVEVMKNIDEFGELLQNNETYFLKVGDGYYNIHVEWAD
ncbi:hypothetical protein [Methanolobus sp. WCC4]|uniref:hypothetical protein n=1 Tax=Methanolobus sp. WCC4 TaxID=3125784 RepID=UPI0030FC0027